APARRARAGRAVAPPPHGHLGAEPGGEAVLLVAEVRLEDRPDDQQHRHLRHAVANGRYAQRALPAVALGDPYPKEGLRSVLRPSQLLPQRRQPRPHAGRLDLLERLPIYARRATVGAATPVRFGQDVRAADLVPQRVEPIAGGGLGFRL